MDILSTTTAATAASQGAKENRRTAGRTLQAHFERGGLGEEEAVLGGCEHAGITWLCVGGRHGGAGWRVNHHVCGN